MPVLERHAAEPPGDSRSEWTSDLSRNPNLFWLLLYPSGDCITVVDVNVLLFSIMVTSSFCWFKKQLHQQMNVWLISIKKISVNKF